MPGPGTSLYTGDTHSTQLRRAKRARLAAEGSGKLDGWLARPSQQKQQQQQQEPRVELMTDLTAVSSDSDSDLNLDSNSDSGMDPNLVEDRAEIVTAAGSILDLGSNH